MNLFSGTNFEDVFNIHQNCAKQIYQYCVNNRLRDAWPYLYRNWYTHEKWILWSRSATLFIPNGKSTMMIEAHWKVLKRKHLINNNRPRLDFLTYIILEKNCTFLLQTYEQKVLQRRDFFQWERDFVVTWNKMYRMQGKLIITTTKIISLLTYDISIIIIYQVSDSDYATDVNRWVCGCPTFYTNRFLLCKHLIQESGRGNLRIGQHFIKRQVDVPFVMIEGVSQKKKGS